jgi:hypothetical protein
LLSPRYNQPGSSGAWGKWLTGSDCNRGESLPGPKNLRDPFARKFGRLRRQLRAQLSRILTPLSMGVLFFAVVSPVAIVMRLAGKDPLGLRFERDRPSYWRARASQGRRQTSMTKQY